MSEGQSKDHSAVWHWFNKQPRFYVSPKVDWKSTAISVEATSFSSKDEVLAVMEPLYFLRSQSNRCAAAWAFADEYYQDEDSPYQPYLAYLFENTYWSWSDPAAVDLIRTIVGKHLEPQLSKDFFYFECLDKKERKEYSDYDEAYKEDLNTALELLEQMQTDALPIPFYDEIVATTSATITQEPNVQVLVVKEQLDKFTLKVISLRDIHPGETLRAEMIDLPMNEATPRWTKTSTPRLFQLTGTIGQGPTTWDFLESWELPPFQVCNPDKHRDCNGSKLRWLWPNHSSAEQNSFTDEQLNVIYNHWKRLRGLESLVTARTKAGQLQETSQSDRHDFSSDYYLAIFQYYQALTSAFEQAWIAMNDGDKIDPPITSVINVTTTATYTAIFNDIQEPPKIYDDRAAVPLSQGISVEGIGTVSSTNWEDHLTAIANDLSTDIGQGFLAEGGNLDDGGKPWLHLLEEQHRSYDTLEESRDQLEYQVHVAGGGCPSWEERASIVSKDESSSRYSELTFTHSYYPNADIWESCLRINDWLQSCSGFRPHYHEMVVHYPATFIDQVRRVLFLGGGDIMIIHEILKYNSTLELVVGMELDQQVLRSSFRNTGIQPNFHNPVVHWVFGDATHSLLMVPPDWYGSFDLVVVDLQNFVFDTVMVTEELNIMEMAMLMVHPDHGVVARNDDFVRRRNMGFARYEVEIELLDVPQLCQQSISLGSNGVDFLTKKPVNHGVESVYFDPVRHHSSTIWTNYRNLQQRPTITPQDSNDNKDNSKIRGDGNKKDLATNYDPAVKAYGLLAVLEVENVTIPLSLSTLIKTNLHQALVEKMGFTLVGSPLVLINTTASSIVALTLREGYLVARTFPQDRYCAMDLMLWADFHKQHQTMEAIVEAIGGRYRGGISTTKYSIVASGIYGIRDNIQERDLYDADSSVATTTADHLPSLVELDEGIAKYPSLANSLSNAEWNVVLSEMVASWFPPSPINVKNDTEKPLWVVMCPERSVVPCQSLDTLLSSPSSIVVPLWACPSVVNGTESQLALCEYSSEQLFRRVVSRKQARIRGLVLDHQVPQEMGQILHKIVNRTSIRLELLGTDFLILDGVASHWSDNLLERIRTEMIRFNPVFHADSVFSRRDRSAAGKLGILSVGFPNFYSHLHAALGSIKEKNWNLDSEVLGSRAGVLNYMPDYRKSTTPSIKDYDWTDARKQWLEQRPLGHQTMYRFEVQLPKVVLQVGDAVIVNEYMHVWYGTWYSGTVTGVNDDGTYNVLDADGKNRKKVNRDRIRKMENSASRFKFGDRVLLRLYDFEGYDEVWYQGSITGGPRQGSSEREYMVQIFDDNFGEMVGTLDNMVHEFEPPDSSVEWKISREKLINAVEETINVLVPANPAQDEVKDVMQVADLGEGCVITALWAPGGSMVVTWDGRTRLDVNLFTPIDSQTEKQDRKFRKGVEKLFLRSFKYLKTASVDEQPRGIGRIVNNKRELESFWFGALDDHRNTLNNE